MWLAAVVSADPSCLVTDASSDSPLSLLQKGMGPVPATEPHNRQIQETEAPEPSESTVQPAAQAVQESAFDDGASLLTVPGYPHSDWDGQQRVAPKSLLPGDKFGSSVCVSGDWAVVGASCGAGCSGSAYFYKLRQDKWRLVQKVKPFASAVGDYFGGGCAMDGDTVAFYPTVPDPFPQRGGAVYIFRLKGDRWKEVQQILPIDAFVTAFGFSVSIFKPKMIIGAPLFNQSGAVYIFTQRESGRWERTAFITSQQIEPPPPAFFGYWVAISHHAALVGAPDVINKTDGAAYALELAGDTWMSTKLPWSPVQPTNFGWSLDIKGNTAVVGDGLANGNKGAVYVFKNIGLGQWVLTQELAPNFARVDDQFSWLVLFSRNSNFMIVSAFPAVNAGYAVVYELQGSNWTFYEKLTAKDSFAGNAFGQGVAIYGRTAAVGAFVPYAERGACYFYDLRREGR